MINQIRDTFCDTFGSFINRSAKDTQPNLTASAILPESVLQILTDVNCVPPADILARLEKNVVHLQAQCKLVLTSKLLLGAGIVLTVTSIASAIFGKFLLSCSLAILGIVVTKKFLRSLPTSESIDNCTNALKADMDSACQWLKQIGARKEQNDLSSEQLEAVNKAQVLVILQLLNAKKRLENALPQGSTEILV